jgi:succinate dehydrogenase / fumarate reductase cytochrome b subunit
MFYHLANGVRHLIWDAGHGLDLKSANSSAYAVFGFTIAATLAIWVIAFMAGVV